MASLHNCIFALICNIWYIIFGIFGMFGIFGILYLHSFVTFGTFVLYWDPQHRTTHCTRNNNLHNCLQLLWAHFLIGFPLHQPSIVIHSKSYVCKPNHKINKANEKLSVSLLSTCKKFHVEALRRHWGTKLDQH